MKWFYKWFGNKITQARHEGALAKSVEPVALSSRFDQDGGLNIRIHKAIGGKIICFNRYDQKLDRHNNTTYILTDEQDFERELGKIITLESMKQ